MRIVIGIRTHKWDEAENILYQKLTHFFGKNNVFIVVDELKNQVTVPSRINKLSMNIDTLNTLKLLTSTKNYKIGWLCGDYFYYILQHHISANYYWLIEPDVDFTFDNIADFFSLFQNEDSDALLYNYIQANKNWYWRHKAQYFYEQPYQTFFPLSRLSYDAVSKCLSERQTICKSICKSILHGTFDEFNYLNDESLVASTIHKYKLQVKIFKEFLPQSFQYFRYKKYVTPAALKRILPKNQVVHSVGLPPLSLDTISKDLIEQIDNLVKDGHIIHTEDLNCMLNKLCNQVITYIKSYTEPLYHIENIVENFLLKEKLEYRKWFYKQNILVFDIHQKLSPVVEFCISCNTIECLAFYRETPIQINIDSTAYPTLTKKGNKTLLFSKNIEQLSDVDTYTALQIFYQSLKE